MKPRDTLPAALAMCLLAVPGCGTNTNQSKENADRVEEQNQAILALRDDVHDLREQLEQSLQSQRDAQEFLDDALPELLASARQHHNELAKKIRESAEHFARLRQSGALTDEQLEKFAELLPPLIKQRNWLAELIAKGKVLPNKTGKDRVEATRSLYEGFRDLNSAMERHLESIQRILEPHIRPTA